MASASPVPFNNTLITSFVSRSCSSDIIIPSWVKGNNPLPIIGGKHFLLITPMPGQGTTKHENHPHPSLPRREGGIKGRDIFI